ncbi:MAG: LemA family protein [Thermoanaerobaculaceae bacterium]|nr:LemA family protein [Thermoanaerobaculaceae bacterium]MDI9621953.1 LemA family protein [Acidobacteriota bacterium]NLH12233.1 LemA family protein [Holophagae bacterium]HPW55633.1 LemA family protein [Thermoanaerobaculaceae bacterium]
MKKLAIGCAVVAVIALVLAMVVALGSYNRLVGLDESVKAAWGQVENVYQRRADLVPNLVETVKGARDFERDTLTAVVEARAKISQINLGRVPTAGELQQFQSAQDGLSSALSRLLVVVERYPELKATEAFRDLQAQLEGTENRIAVERKRFNDAAQAFNTARRRFPTVLVAGLLGFSERPYFQATPGSDRPPQVKF